MIAPRPHDAVALRNGTTGWVRGVIAHWPAFRCWDVYLSDPEYDGDPPAGFPHSPEERGIRNAQIRGLNLGGPPWKEVKP